MHRDGSRKELAASGSTARNLARWTAATILALCLAAGCATAPVPGTPAPAEAAPAAGPVLRLLEVTPRDGMRVDSGTVLVATLAYHIPAFDPSIRYTVSAVFAGSQGGSFNRGGGEAELRSPTGIVTVRHSLDGLWADGRSLAASPLSGSFFLLEHAPHPTVEDTVDLGVGVRIRTMRNSASVRARTRTIHFNGAGPGRSLAAGLPELYEEYWTYRPHKALAVAYAASDRWTYGYAFGYRSADDAAARAMEECRASAVRRRVDAPCRLVAIDGAEPEPPM